MKLQKLAGATSEIWQIFIADSSSSTGAGLAGLTNASSGLTAYYHRDTDTTATAISLVTMTVGTFTSSGFKEIDATNMPGWYQFCPPNAALASGAKSCAFHLKGATNMAPIPIEVQLTAVNPDSATAFLTGVNSVAPPTNWNLMGIDASGRVDLGKWIGNAPNALQSGRVDSYLGAVASGVIAAASFASGALDAVWSTATRTLSTGAIVAGTFAANALDAVWATTARLLTAGTNIVLAKGVGVTGFTDLDAAGVRTAVGLASANLDTQLDALPTAAEVAAQITTDHGAGSYIRNTEPDNSSITAIKAKTDNLPSDPADASDIASSFSTVAGTLATIAGYIDTEVAAIKAKTDNLPSDPADASDIAASFATVNGTLTTIAGYIDTEVAAIKAKTDNLPSDPADESLLEAAIAAIPTGTAPTAAAIADAVWDEAESGHTTAGTFGRYLDARVSQIGAGSGGGGHLVIT